LQRLHSLQTMLRLANFGALDAAAAPEGLRAALVRATGAVDFAALSRELNEDCAATAACFDRLIDRPAAATKQEQGVS
jgi:glutathione S-transferase